MEDLIEDGKKIMTELSNCRRRLVSCERQCSRLARELALCESRERRRLAEYLHDRLGQSLYFAEMKIEDLWEEKAGGPDAELLDDLKMHLQRATDELRALMKEMYPQTLVHLGLAPAILALVEEVQIRHRIEIEFKPKGKLPSVPEDLSHLVYRTTRELVVNALKHAGSKKIWIRMERKKGGIEICVGDEGVGFDPTRIFNRGGYSPHFGLMSIRERLESLGGVLDIESRPGKGSRITFYVPFT